MYNIDDISSYSTTPFFPGCQWYSFPNPKMRSSNIHQTKAFNLHFLIVVKVYWLFLILRVPGPKRALQSDSPSYYFLAGIGWQRHSFLVFSCRDWNCSSNNIFFFTSLPFRKLQRTFLFLIFTSHPWGLSDSSLPHFQSWSSRGLSDSPLPHF